MLRPATPLTILLFVSFVLLLISVISTPIVKGIPIARYQGVNFGVFGWCKDNGECSKFTVGWNTDDALLGSDDGEFNLPSSARHSLSSLLIVHPVAALCNLIVLGLAVAAHLHSPSHSARYLLGLLILLLPTLLITLLAFLVDILLFVPHLQWGGWIVLASTILITASGVVTCAMRRTLVSRKARKKRIAENPEMSGENYYSHQAQEARMMPALSTESKAPMVNGAPGADSLPTFATFSHSRRSEERPVGSSPTEPVSATSPIDGGRYYGAPRSRSNSRPRQQDFGAPLGAAMSYEERPPMPPTPARGGYGPPRGRGGYAQRGAMSSRGSLNSRGPPPSPYGRGGYGPRGRGGYSGAPTPPGMIPAGLGSRPPPGYPPQESDNMQDGYGPPQVMPGPITNVSYARPAASGYEPPSPSNYGLDANTAYGPTAYRAPSQSSAGRRASPYGSRAQSPSGAHAPLEVLPAMPPMPNPSQYAQANHQRTATGCDSDVSGMVGRQRVALQQEHQRFPSQEYVAPRAAWTDGQASEPRSPVRRKRLSSGASDYMEDVDPKFAEPPVPSVAPAADFEPPQMPTILTAGRNPNEPSPVSSQEQIPRAHSYEDMPGARSPVESEVSNFTSVSQRPMNPNWQPGHGGEFNSFGPGQVRQQQRRQDMLFSNNPDFELPGMGPPRSRGGFGGRGRGGYMGRQNTPMRPPPLSALEGISGDGRYPAPMPPPGATGSSGGGVMKEI